MFWFNRSKKKIHIPSVDKLPEKQHKKAIRSIEDASERVDELKRVVIENGFTMHIVAAARGKR